MYSFPDSQESVGAYQGLLWLSHSSDHPEKFLADFMIAPPPPVLQLQLQAAVMLVFLSCSALRWLSFYVFIFKSGQLPLPLEQLFYTAFSDFLCRITIPRDLDGAGGLSTQVNTADSHCFYCSSLVFLE